MGNSAIEIFHLSQSETVKALAPDATEEMRVTAATMVSCLPFTNGNQASRDAYVQESGDILTGILAAEMCRWYQRGQE